MRVLYSSIRHGPSALPLAALAVMLASPPSALAQLAVAAQASGPGVTVVDVSNPASPVVRGSVLTTLTGISSIAIDPSGSRAVAGEWNGCRIAIINISNPAVPVFTGSACTSFSGVSSVAVTGMRVVVGQQFGPGVEVYDISGAAPVKVGSTLNTVLTGISSIAASGTCAVAGESNGNRVIGLSIGGAGPAVAGTAPNITTFSGVSSVGLSGARGLAGQQFGPVVQAFATAGCAVTLGGTLNLSGLAGVVAVSVSGTRALAGEENGPDVAVVDLTTTAAPVQRGAFINTGVSGVSSVAANGSRAVAGQLSGPRVSVIANLDGPSPALGGNALTSYAGVSSVALTSFSPPSVSLPSSSLAFGNVNVSTTKQLTLVVNNLGGSALNLSAITSTSARYSAPGTLSVPASGSAMLPVTFAPIAAGPVSGTLTATTNDPGTPSISIALTGTGIAPPPVAVIPATLAFGVTRVGSTATGQLSIQNAGGAPLNVTSISSSNGRFVPAATSVTVPAGVTQNLSVTFAPNVEGAVTGTLTATTNDPTHASISVSLSGTGGLPHIQVAPVPLAFGNVAASCQSSTLPMTVSNTGMAPLNVTAINVVAGPYTRTPGSLSVPGGGSAPVQVTFTPVAVGAANGSVTIVNDDPDPAKQSLSVSLTGTGVTPPPPIVGVTPTSLGFGAALVNFFYGKRITVQNTGTCAALTVTLTSSSSVFPVTTDANPMTVPPLAPVSASIPPGSSRSFVVVFAPTATGAASGILTVASNDPATPTISVPLSGTGVQAAASSVSLVFDRSGSMSELVAGGTKMDALKTSAKLFTDLIIEGQGDRLGTVEFDDAFAVLTPIAAVDAAHKTAVKTGINSLFPRGLTSIGGGLQTALAQLSGSTTARQVIMVFTDGMQNVPPAIATVKPTIPATTEVYAVGLGDPAQISAAALTDLAISTSGRFFNPQDALLLRKDFVQVLTDAFRMNMAADPIYRITKGATQSVFVPLSACDHRISFIVYWDNPASQLGVEVVAPNGMTYTAASPASNRLVRYAAQPGYRFFQVAFPPTDLGPATVIGPPRAGNWRIRVTDRGIAGESERYSVSVVVESDLAMKIAIDKVRMHRPVTLTARLTNAGSPVTGAIVTAKVTAPQRGIGQALIDLGPLLKSAARQRMGTDTILDRAQLVRVVSAMPSYRGKRIVATRVKRFRLNDDGEHGDGARNDGTYGLVLPSLEIEGGYDVDVHAQAAACQGTPTREATLSFYAGLQVDSLSSGVRLEPTGTPGGITVTVTPRAVGGSALGPGLAGTISPRVISGTGRVGAVRDNLDGSYSITVQETSPASVLQLDVSGTSLTIPLRRERASPARR